MTKRVGMAGYCTTLQRSAHRVVIIWACARTADVDAVVVKCLWLPAGAHAAGNDEAGLSDSALQRSDRAVQPVVHSQHRKQPCCTGHGVGADSGNVVRRDLICALPRQLNASPSNIVHLTVACTMVTTFL